MGPRKINWWLLHYIALISTLGPLNYQVTEGVWQKLRTTAIPDSLEEHETTSAPLALVYDFEFLDGYPKYYNRYRGDSDENQVRSLSSTDSKRGGVGSDSKGGKRSGSSQSNDENGHQNSKVNNQIKFKYIGCYDSWENSTGHSFTNSYFHDPVSLQGCMDFCNSQDPEHRIDVVSQIKEHFCICYYWENFINVRVDDKYCNVKCTDGDPDSTCGGNYGLSVYCNKDQLLCQEFQLPAIELSYEDEQDIEDHSDSQSEEDVSKSKVFQGCANCTTCMGTYFPFFDYLPNNTPDDCVRFCKRKVRYWAREAWRIRPPTPLAAVGWAKGKLAAIPFASCACLMNDDSLNEVASEGCNQKCPGNEDQICGGEQAFLFSVYETGITAEPVSTSTEPPIPTVAPTTSYDGSSDPGSGSNTSPSPSNPCSTMCSGEDIYGTAWTACAGSIAMQDCPKHASGKATWNCLETGKFEGVTPNYNNCTSLWVKNIEKLVDQSSNMTYPDAAKFLDTLRKNCERAKNLWETDVQYFGHEIKQIFEIVERVVKHDSLNLKIDLPGFEKLASETVFITSSILTNLHTWEQLNLENRSVSATKLIYALEEAMFELTTKATQFGESTYSNSFNTAEALGLYTGVKPKSGFGNRTFQYSAENSYILLPEGWVSAVGTVETEISFLGMNVNSDQVNQVFPNRISTGSKNLLAGSPKSLNANLMSLSLTRPSANSSVQFPVSGKGVEIKFHHDALAWGSNGEVRNIRRKLHPGEKPKAVMGTAVCVYWDTDIGEWSSTGCKLIKSEEAASYCECTHLTAFAVLMSHHNYLGKDFGLEILTLILCPLSIICLFTTIVIFTMVRSTHGQRTTITKNLALCLLVGNTLVLLVTDRHYFNLSPAVCTGAAIFTHYVFLSAFMWMLIEGYHLYKMVVYVFDTGSSYMTIYRVLAYGLPLIMVGITGVVGFLRHDEAYGGEDFCWLQGSYIWSFNVPVAITVLANLCVLFVTMRIAYRVQSSPAQLPIRPKSYKTWIKGCFSITILLGVTWIIGFFMLTDKTGSLVIAYLFTILNASQGILLCVFHCLFNEKVRLAAEKRNINIPIWFSTAQTGTNSSDPSNPSSQQGQRARANMRMYFPDIVRDKDVSASAFRESTLIRRNSNSKMKVKPVTHKNETTTSGTVSSVDSGRSSNSSGYNSHTGSTGSQGSGSAQRNFRN